MDNLLIQVTPIELNHRSSQPLQVSCLLKKIAINTGHTLEKHQLSAFPDSRPGTSTFPSGPTLTLSKELELSNTKISLHFMEKRNRTISCIGSAEVDLATVPSQPVTKINCPLANSVYPHSQLTLELKYSEKPSIAKQTRRKPEEMAILKTEGQVKQELFLKRRKDPSIPTAYEISRKNYKQIETSCRDEQPATKPSPSRRIASRSNKSNSYHQKFTLANSRNKTITNASKDDSPMPRQKTPEPIKLSPANKKRQSMERKKEDRNWKMSGESPREEPSRLDVRPYQDRNYPARYHRDNDDSISNSQGAKENLHGAPRNRYIDITQKLQSIQDKLMGADQKKCRTQASAIQHLQSTFSQQTQQSIDQQPPMTTHRSHDKIQTVSPFPESQQLVSHPHTFQSTGDKPPLVTEKKGFLKQQGQVPSQFRDEIEEQVRMKETQVRLRRQLEGLQSQNQELAKQNELLKGNCLDAESTIKKLMMELNQVVVEKNERNAKISNLQKQVQQSEKRAFEQQQLLSKMTEQYEQKVDELLILQEELNQTSISKEQSESDHQQALWKKRALEAEGNLRLRQNELRHLRLELDNLKGQKRLLEQQLKAVARGNHQEMARQKSLAKIQQVSSNSLIRQTQRENETLRSEVKILQSKVEGLNSVLKSLLESGQFKPKVKEQLENQRSNEQKDEKQKNRRIISLEQRCEALQEQLRSKKSLMAQMVNLIWAQGDPALMESIEKYMDN